MSPNSFTFLQYLNTVFDNIKDSVMLIGVEPGGKLRLLLANKRFHELSGYGKRFIGQNLYEFIGKEHHTQMKKRHNKLMRIKKPMSYMVWSKVPRRGQVAFEVDMIPVLNTVDDVVQIIVLSRDVTKVATLKERVRKLKAALVKARPADN